MSSSEERDRAGTTLLENVALYLTVPEALCVLGLVGLVCYHNTFFALMLPDTIALTVSGPVANNIFSMWANLLQTKM